MSSVGKNLRYHVVVAAVQVEFVHDLAFVRHLHSGPGATPPWSLVACDPAAPATTCETWDQCDGGVEATYCTVAPDHARHFDTTGGHILYLNDTNLSLAAVAWEYFERF